MKVKNVDNYLLLEENITFKLNVTASPTTYRDEAFVESANKRQREQIIRWNKREPRPEELLVYSDTGIGNIQFALLGRDKSLWRLGTCRGHISDWISSQLGYNTFYTKNDKSMYPYLSSPTAPVVITTHEPGDVNRWLTNNNLITVINWLEEEVEVEHRTTMSPTQFPNIFVLHYPGIIMQASPLWSLWSLITRIGRMYDGSRPVKEWLDMMASYQGLSKYPDPYRTNFMQGHWSKGITDQVYLIVALKKIPLFKKHGLNPGKIAKPGDNNSSHEWGIGSIPPERIIASGKAKEEPVKVTTETPAV